MNNITRKQRRKYLSTLPMFKAVKKQNFLSEDRSNIRKGSMEAGQKQFTENFERAQRQVVETLAPTEGQIMGRLKSLGLTQDVIDNYMEVWADINMWPKSKEASNKKLKNLNRELGVW